MILTVFRSRLRPEYKAQYEEIAARMLELARSMPGFVSIKTFTAEDGERVSLIEFDTEEDLLRWRDHPDHSEAQQLGRSRFYSTYSFQVCNVERACNYTCSETA